MKSLLKNAVFAISLSLGAATIMAVPTLSVQAAVPTDASLLKLIEVTKVVEMVDEMSNDSVLTDQMTQAMLASMPSNNMTKQQRRSFDKIISKYSKELMSNNDMESINQQVIKAYIKSAKQNFNQKEIDAQISFYSSNVGQSIIDKQPAMMKDYMTEIMPIIMAKNMQQMQEIMPRMVADIEALMLKR